MKKQRFPVSWNEQRVKDLIAHYESQKEDEEFAEIEAVPMAEDIALMAIPTEPCLERRCLPLDPKHPESS